MNQDESKASTEGSAARLADDSVTRRASRIQVPRVLCDLVRRHVEQRGLKPIPVGAALVDGAQSVSLATQVLFMEASARQVADTNLGLTLGAGLARGAFGLREFLLRSAPTWREALTQFQAAAPAWLGPVDVRLRDVGEQLVLSVSMPGQPLALGTHAMTLVAASLVSWGRQLTAGGFRVASARFTHAAPSQSAAYQLSVSEQVGFGADALELAFEDEVADLALVSADAALFGLLLDLFPHEPYERSRVDLISRVMVAAREGLLQGGAPLEAIAARLGMSGRSLQRQLASQGSSYQWVLDHVRQELAKESLALRSMSVRQISERLGYSEAAGFVRAFRKWTGLTPGDYRQTFSSAKRLV